MLKSKAKQHAISHLFNKPIDPKASPSSCSTRSSCRRVSAAVVLTSSFSLPPRLASHPRSSRTRHRTHHVWSRQVWSDQQGALYLPPQEPKSGEYEEKHVKYPAYPKLAKTTSLYTLVVNPDQSFEIFINNESKKKGSLLEDFEPPVNPPAEIDDPEDKKPADWVEQAKITDPTATKPADWDEDAPLEIPDEDAVKPEGWLEDEPLTIPRPRRPEARGVGRRGGTESGSHLASPTPSVRRLLAVGEWVRPVVRNPALQGQVVCASDRQPRLQGCLATRARSPTPTTLRTSRPPTSTPSACVGFELWTMDEDILFDNIYIGHDPAQAKAFSAETFEQKIKIEQGQEDKEKETAAKAADRLPLHAAVSSVRCEPTSTPSSLVRARTPSSDQGDAPGRRWLGRRFRRSARSCGSRRWASWWQQGPGHHQGRKKGRRPHRC